MYFLKIVSPAETFVTAAFLRWLGCVWLTGSGMPEYSLHLTPDSSVPP